MLARTAVTRRRVIIFTTARLSSELLEALFFLGTESHDALELL
jgi:hypothetical protein